MKTQGKYTTFDRVQQALIILLVAGVIALGAACWTRDRQAAETQEPLFGNVQVYMGRQEIRAINVIKNYFGNHMDELED